MQQSQASEIAERNKRLVPAQYISKSKTGMVVGTAFTLSWVVPAGYSRCTEILFNPDDDVSITLFAQFANTNVLQDFSTKIGSALGSIQPGFLTAPNDQIQATCTPKTIAGTDFTLTLKFE